MKPNVWKWFLAAGVAMTLELQAEAQLPVSPEDPHSAPVATESAMPAENWEVYNNGPAGRRLLGTGFLRSGEGPVRSHLHGGWGGVEALVWWNKGRHMPALVTTSTPGTSQADAAVLGLTSTSILFGNSQIGSDPQVGARISFGAYIDCEQNTGLGVRFTAMEGDKTRYDATTDGSLILGRPYFDVTSGQQDAVLIGFPGEFSGDIHVRTANDFLMNDIYGRFRMTEECVNRIDLILGYQLARVDDDLNINSTTTIINPNSLFNGTQFNITDDIRCRNEYHGGTIGIMGERCNGRARITWMGKVGYGLMQQEVTLNGENSITSGAATITQTGGLVTQNSNIGTYKDNRDVFVPELDLNLHFHVTQNIDFSLGYSFVYFTTVSLAGDQVDRRVNLTQQGGTLVGAALPGVLQHHSDFWYQGLNLGLNGRF